LLLNKFEKILLVVALVLFENNPDVVLFPNNPDVPKILGF
jgi:hypothetical protein